jgi:hypothetical protein
LQILNPSISPYLRTQLKQQQWIVVGAVFLAEELRLFVRAVESTKLDYSALKMGSTRMLHDLAQRFTARM